MGNYLFQCRFCDSERSKETRLTRALAFGRAAPVTVVVNVRSCIQCGRPALPDEWERRARAEVLRKVALSGNGGAKSFRFMRRALGLSAKEVAIAFHVGVGTLSRWENGVRRVEPRAWALMAALALETTGGEALPSETGIRHVLQELVRGRGGEDALPAEVSLDLVPPSSV